MLTIRLGRIYYFIFLKKSSIKEDTRKHGKLKRWKVVKPIISQRTFFTEVTGNKVDDYYARNIYVKVSLKVSCSVDLIDIKNTFRKH